MPRRPNLAYSAPVLSVDLAAFDDNGDAYEIWPCHDCLPWHVEVVLPEDPTDDFIAFTLVREWHAAECPMLLQLLDNNAQDDA